MTTTLPAPAPRATVSAGPAAHWASGLLAPLDQLAASSSQLIVNHGPRFEVGGRSYFLPSYLFLGPQDGGDPLRLGLFAGVHGDEPEGVHALLQFLRLLVQQPALATGYLLFAYPICNPTGFEDETRYTRRGSDLNRLFWQNSSEPEVRQLEEVLTTHRFHGLIALHTDDTSDGVYGFVRGATLTQHLIEPALAAAGQILPRNRQPVIDGFPARNGIIQHGYDGVLAAAPGTRPRPFEITLETPKAGPEFLKRTALVVALQTILTQYRQFIAFAPNL
ncbi:MAG: succinylglutamate desuccinylase/aspartoacylase family protein [Verrucomicrobiota bacterium]